MNVCRVFLGVFMLAGTFLHGQDDPAAARIMTYNIWYDNPGNTGNTWTDRVDGVLGTLMDLAPDILCVQEALLHQLADLKEAGYSSIGAGRDDGKEAGEFTAILYRPDRFELLDEGTFWLSPYPDSAGSVGWDAILPRIATWAALRDGMTGSEFFVINTHFSHVGEIARLESVRLILEKALVIAGDGPLLITGDFNFRRDAEAYQYMTSEHDGRTLFDARDQVNQSEDDPGYSFVGSDFIGEPGHIIDHIFISDRVEVIRAGIRFNSRNGRCPSDHLPVVVDFLIQ